MNARERFHAVMNFEKIPSLKAEFGYWTTTVKRFIKEGMPVVEALPPDIPDNSTISGATKIDPWSSVIEDKNIRSYFKLDSYIAKFPIDFSPQFKEKLLEEDEEYKTYIDSYGIKTKIRKKGTSAPMLLSFPIANRRDFERYKEHYDKDYSKRLPKNWDALTRTLRKRDYPIRLGGYPFGFFGFPRHLMGVQGFFLTLYDDPTLVREINEFFLHFVMEYWAGILEKIAPDCVLIWEDMAGKTGSMISPVMFREFMLPYYLRIVDFVHQYGVKNIFVDSDGFIEELIPLWVEAGVTGIFPIEVQSGNDIIRIRGKYPQLQLLGGVDKRVLIAGSSEEDIDGELRKVEKVLKTGGYIPHIDHHVPDDACWENFRYYRNRLNEIIEKVVA